MSEIRYSPDHEWAAIESPGIARIGITEYAQKELGDIVFVDLPDVGAAFDAGEEVAVIESVKAADGLKTPVSGEVTEINEDLDSAPETVNESPMERGWFCKIALAEPSELEDMMSESDYENYISSLA